MKPNQFSVSYHIAQYTNIIADLRKEIFRLKLKISEHDADKSNESSSKLASIFIENFLIWCLFICQKTIWKAWS